MNDEYKWAIGLRASFEPVTGDDDSPDSITGKIIEVRDDSPWPDEEHVRIVLETPDGVYDVAKDRIELE